MKTPMKSFRGSPLLNSNMLQTLFPTSIPLIRTNLALYLLYDFFLSSVFFPLTPLFRGKHFLATNILITWCCFLLCIRHFHIILFAALFRLLSAFLLVRLLFVVGFRLAFRLFFRPCLFRLQVHHFFRLFFFLFSVFILLISSLIVIISAFNIRISSVALAFVSLIHCLVILVFLRSFSASLSIFISCLVTHSLHSLSAFFASY